MLRINSGIVSKHAKILTTCIKSQGDETIQHVVSLMKKFAIGIMVLLQILYFIAPVICKKVCWY